MLVLLPFHLILTSGSILIAKNHSRVILGSLDSFKVCIIIFVGDPYYEPTIMVHDTVLHIILDDKHKATQSYVARYVKVPPLNGDYLLLLLQLCIQALMQEVFGGEGGGLEQLPLL